MKRILFRIAAHPLPALGVVAALTVGLAFEIPRLVIDTSAEGFMVEKDPERIYYEEVKRKFGSDDLTVVLLKARDVFTPGALGAIRRISDALERAPGVTRVESVTTVRKIAGDDESIDTRPLVGPEIPSSPEALARLRADALGNRVVAGNLVAADGRAAAIVAYTQPPPGDVGFNKRFVELVERLIEREARPGLELYEVGSPLLKVTFAEYIVRDQRTLVPLCAATLFLVLYLVFRTARGVLIPLVTATVSVTWAAGLMSLFGLPLTVVTSMVPPILIVIGFTEDVHMLAEYDALVARGRERRDAIRAMLDQAALPVAVTTGTTVVGFGSLIASDVTMLRQFGYASSLALTANYVVTMMVVPAMLALLPAPARARRTAPEAPVQPGRVDRLMEWIGWANLRYRTPIVIATVALCAVAIIGLSRLQVETDFIDYFPDDSPLPRRHRDMHERLAGAEVFSLVVETGRENGIKDPDVLRRVAALQDFLGKTGEVDKTISIADYLRTMNRELHGGDARYDGIPGSSEEVAQYLLILDGPELSRFIDTNASTANIVVRHNLSGSGHLSALLARIDRYVAGAFPRAIQVRPAGEGILINRAADIMAVNEVTSFTYTFVIIGIIHAALFMSLTAGFLSLIPNVIPILVTYGLMGFLGIPLNTGTALIATIAIGIAVDDTVHHMVTYSRRLNDERVPSLAMFSTLRALGPPIIYVSLALAAGFLVLALSSFVPMSQYGYLAALTMVVAMITELVVTPVLMVSTRLVTPWDLLLLRMHPDRLRDAPLFKGLSEWEMRKVVLFGQPRSVPAGETIIQKGDAGRELYMIVSGRVRVFDGQGDRERTLATLEAGAIFGEIAMVSGGVRTANVVADTPAELISLDFDTFDRLRRRFPFTGAKLYRNLAHILSERLRDTTARLTAPAP